MNNIAKLHGNTFGNLKFLHEINLSGNKLQDLSADVFKGISALKVLYLQGNNFKLVPSKAFENLEHLQYLHLDANRIRHVPDGSLRRLHSLQYLWLDANNLTSIPTKELRHLKKLEALNLAVNEITKVEDNAFEHQPKLGVLLLHSNKIEHIGKKAFRNLMHLQILELHKNRLHVVPAALKYLPDLKELSLDNNRISHIPDYAFETNSQLFLLKLNNNPLKQVDKHSFVNLPKLDKLILSNLTDQRQMLDFTGTNNIEVLRLDGGGILSIPDRLCWQLPKLRTLDLHSNQISSIPDMSSCISMSILNLGQNKINNLCCNKFRGAEKLKELTLSNNQLSAIGKETLRGLKRLKYLDMSNNKICDIHNEAFTNLYQTEEINLSNNHIRNLPEVGLQNLRILKMENNFEMMEFPRAKQFPRIKKLSLTYAYHCCEFRKVKNQELPVESRFIGSSLKPKISLNTSENFKSSNSTRHPGFIEEILKEFESHDSSSQSSRAYQAKYSASAEIQCNPSPGPLQPCDNLIGWWSLRGGVWMIFVVAVIANGCVFVTLMFGRKRQDTTCFLMCNLAVADLCMGVYVGFLALADTTLGNFYRHALNWQAGTGCNMTGFLAVFSSQLSVFTLTVMSLERCLAVNSQHSSSRKLSVKNSVYIMFCGWLFSLCLASLPLVGINSYSSFAICLPLNTNDTLAIGYIIFLMLLNAIAFITILLSYVQMAYVVWKTRSRDNPDWHIAKKMSLIVFTDVICWIPVCLFSVVAIFGDRMVSAGDAKIFAIFMLPLNSCINPILYIIFNKWIRNDCLTLCKVKKKSRRHDTEQARFINPWRASLTEDFEMTSSTKEFKSDENALGDGDSGIVDFNTGKSIDLNDKHAAESEIQCDEDQFYKIQPRQIQEHNMKEHSLLLDESCENVTSASEGYHDRHLLSRFCVKHSYHGHSFKRKANDLLSSPKRLLTTCTACTQTGSDYEIMPAMSNADLAQFQNGKADDSDCQGHTKVQVDCIGQEQSEESSEVDISLSKPKSVDTNNLTKNSYKKVKRKGENSNLTTYQLWCNSVSFKWTNNESNNTCHLQTDTVNHPAMDEENSENLEEILGKQTSSDTLQHLLSIPGYDIASRLRDSGYSLSNDSCVSNSDSLNNTL